MGNQSTIEEPVHELGHTDDTRGVSNCRAFGVVCRIASRRRLFDDGGNGR